MTVYQKWRAWQKRNPRVVGWTYRILYARLSASPAAVGAGRACRATRKEPSMETHLPAVATAEQSPLAFIQRALDQGIKPSDCKELFDLQVRHEQRMAEERYADAITAFQAECPPIHKSKSGAKGAYNYAPYEAIMGVITPLLRKHRIVLSFDSDCSQPGKVAVVCRVRVGTVEKPTTITFSVAEGNRMMSATQVDASAVSMGKRYAVMAALNLVCTDEDTDGVPDARCTNGQLDELNGLMAEYEKATGRAINEERFLSWLGARDYASITPEQHRRSMDYLRRQVAQARKEGAA